jgi:hypothetical protein
MGKPHKHTKRGNHYQTMAAGYQILRSPLADSYNAAAEHYRERDPPVDPRSGSDAAPNEMSAPESGRN